MDWLDRADAAGSLDSLDDAPAPNQLAALAADSPLLPPSQQLLTGRVRAGVTRRRGCGVCHACLFTPNTKACLATRTVAHVAAAEVTQLRGRQKRSRARQAERELDAQHARAAASESGALARVCRLCKCLDHRATECPLVRCLAAEAPPEDAGAASGAAAEVARWSASMDAPMRAVLLCVQQLASARVAARSKRSRVAQVGALAPEQLRRVELALRALAEDNERAPSAAAA